MSHHLSASRNAATFALCVSAICCWTNPASAQCVSFKAAGMPLFACIRGLTGGFLAAEGGQRSVIAPRLENQEGPFFALFMNYKTGFHVGPWTPEADFHLTLRLDNSEAFGGKLTAEFCASGPVLVTFPTGGSSALRYCGDRMIVINPVEWPNMKTRVLN